MMPGLDGKCSWRRPFEHGFEIQISVTNKRRSESFRSLDKPSRRRNYISTLIHEMVHAVFQLYCCQTCTPCNDRYINEVGTSGHGMPWQKLAISIEDVLNQCPVFIGTVAFDLGRSEAFCQDYCGDAKFLANTSLQDSLTIRQLEGLKQDTWAFEEIEDLLRIRNMKRAAARRRDAAARRKGLKQKKKGVLGGRTSKSNWPHSRH